jgi:hypothetical protein
MLQIQRSCFVGSIFLMYPTHRMLPGMGAQAWGCQDTTPGVLEVASGAKAYSFQTCNEWGVVLTFPSSWNNLKTPQPQRHSRATAQAGEDVLQCSAVIFGAALSTSVVIIGVVQHDQPALCKHLLNKSGGARRIAAQQRCGP